MKTFLNSNKHALPSLGLEYVAKVILCDTIQPCSLKGTYTIDCIKDPSKRTMESLFYLSRVIYDFSNKEDSLIIP